MHELPEFDLITGPAKKVLPVQFPGQEQPRRFVLTEQTPAELVAYFRRQDQAKRNAIAQLESELPNEDTLAKATELFLDLLSPTIVQLLSCPYDGMPGATTEEVRSLTARQREAIIKAQDELSGLAEALGNGLGLLEVAMPRQVASTLLSLNSEPTAPDVTSLPTR